MNTSSTQSNKYNLSLKNIKKKVRTLESVLVDENKGLAKLQTSLKSSRERVSIAKKKASTSSSIKKSANLTIKKHEKLTKQVNAKKARIKRVRENLKEAKAELKKIDTEKKQYESAMKKYEKQWLKFYANTKKDNVNAEGKVDFSLQIRASRALLNLSEREFSKLIGINPNLLDQIEQSNSNTILEPHLLKSIKRKLKNAGVELIDNGFYVGIGGVGARMRTLPSNAAVIKPKTRRAKREKAKSTKVKKNKKARALKVA